MRSLARHPGWIVAVLLVASAAMYVAARLRAPSVPVARALRRDLEQHLVASGRVRVPTRISIASQVPGLVVVVGAVEGQRVQPGDLLLQIDDAEARAAVAQAKAAVDQAAARVAQLRKVGAIVATEASRQAETNLLRAQNDLERAQKLTDSGALAETQLEDARQKLAIARAQKSAAEAQQIAATPMGADSRVALSALLQSQAQLAAANVRLEQTRVIAPQKGVILERSVEPGDVTPSGKTVLVLAVDADTELMISPDERNLAWLRVGQPARVSADAYPQAVFEAEVSYIAPSVDPQRGSIEVRLRAAAPPAFLKPDMTVSVDLTVASKRQVLTLPSDSVRGAATAGPWVFVAERGRVVRRNVTLGVRGQDVVEVASGLEEGAAVLIAGNRALVPGQRVRPEQGAP